MFIRTNRSLFFFCVLELAAEALRVPFWTSISEVHFFQGNECESDFAPKTLQIDISEENPFSRLFRKPALTNSIQFAVLGRGAYNDPLKVSIFTENVSVSFVFRRKFRHCCYKTMMISVVEPEMRHYLSNRGNQRWNYLRTGV